MPPGLRYDPFGPDRNCSDFDTYQEALDFYRAAGGPASRSLQQEFDRSTDDHVDRQLRPFRSQLADTVETKHFNSKS